MKKSKLFVCFLLLAASAFAQELKFAPLGNFKLENGQIIRDCRLGYRTFGKLNRDQSNVILFPTWFTGTTKNLIEFFGPGKLVDTSKYYVIAVDALGDGVSSSPSNSRLQPHMRFPAFSIRDMVASQHAMLTRVLHIPHLHAVMGISMGGMQSFQWILSYPDFMDKAIPIHGSPQLAPYDLLLWQTMKDAVEHDTRWKNGDYTPPLHIRTASEISDLALTTPDRYNRENTRQKFFESLKADAQQEQLQKSAVRGGSRGVAALKSAARKPGVEKLGVEQKDSSSASAASKNANPPEEDFDPDDRIRQIEAMMNHDVSAPFGGSMERAVAAVKVPLLVIVDRHDHMVTPGPALNFARLAHAPSLELQSDCGHIAAGCEEAQRVKDTVAQFLAK